LISASLHSSPPVRTEREARPSLHVVGAAVGATVGAAVVGATVGAKVGAAVGQMVKTPSFLSFLQAGTSFFKVISQRSQPAEHGT